MEIKVKTSIKESDIRKSEQVLIDNGIEPDEAQTVLQALGYTLIDTELYGNDVATELHNKKVDWKTRIKQEIVGQLINMLINDIMHDNGTEPFLGWLADGEVYDNLGYNEDEVKDIMAVAEKVADAVDNMVYQIETATE